MAKRDLTSGSIATGILSMAVPMIGGSILQSIQSMVDMFFVGRLGSDALAAVGMSGAAIMILITIYIGLNISTAAMVARAIGEQDQARANHVAGQSLILTVICSVFVGIVGYLVSPAVLKALGAKGTVVTLGTGYLHVTFVGVFFLCAAFILGGIFYGAGDATTPLLLGILATVCNCILNPLLIFGYLGFPELGVTGSAVATIIARALSFAVGMILLLRRRLRVRLQVHHFIPDPRTMWTILRIGVPSSLQMSVRTLMNLGMMAIVAKFGTLVIAAYTIAVRIRMIGMFPLFGFGGAASTMVGQNLGAERPDRAVKSAYVACALGLVAAAIGATAFFVFARPLIGVFSKSPGSPEVIAVGARLLRITAFGLFGSAIGVVLSRSMNGAGDTMSPLVISIISLWGFQFPVAVYLSGVEQVWGVTVPFRAVFSRVSLNTETGVWYAMVAASVLYALLATGWFLTGRWKHARVTD